MSRIDVVHTVSGLAESSGGPSRSVVGLANSLARRSEIKVTLITQHSSGSIMIPDTELVEFVSIQTGRLGAMTALPFSKKLRGILKDRQQRIVHAHGIWNAASFWTGVLSKRIGVPFVLNPRGMLEPWCLRHKALKKKVAMMLYQRRLLEAVDLFVATSEQELENIRVLGFKQPIALIPNGVSLPQYPTLGSRQEKGSRLRKALFLSRIHPIKGLLNLVRAWARVSPTGWKLVVAGPNEGNHWAEVEKLINTLGLNETIEYVGPVEGEKKNRLFRESELFILPSFSENFSIVVAEALSYGLPVITTTGTPWAGLVARECGWWVEATEMGLSLAMIEAVKLPPGDLEKMGEQAREYAREFEWKHIAHQMAESYRWVINGGEKPREIDTCV